MNFIKKFILKLKDRKLSRRARKCCQLGMEALMFIRFDQVTAKIPRQLRRQWWRDFVYSPSNFEYCVYQYIKVLKQLRGKNGKKRRINSKGINSNL